MKKSVILGLGVAATLALSPVSAKANGFHHFHHFKHFKHFKHFHHFKPPVVKAASGPSHSVHNAGTPAFAVWAAATVGCSTVGLMVGAAVYKNMKIQEAEYIVGNCTVPFVGGEFFKFLRQEMTKMRMAEARRRGIKFRPDILQF